MCFLVPGSVANVSAFLLALAALLSNGCGGKRVYPQNELANQIISARANHPGVLTNQACKRYDGDKCMEWSVKTYDLKDAEIRDKLIRFRFICKIANRRFKICRDEPGFCRLEFECNFLQKIFGGCQKKWEKIPLDPHQRLVDGRARCFSEKSYGWDEVK